MSVLPGWNYRRVGFRALFSAAVFLAATSWRVCLAQSPCTVLEARRLNTVSGQFSAGSLVMQITVPTSLFHGQPLVLFPEISDLGLARRQTALYLEAASNRIAVESGATLRLEADATKRLLFTLTNAEGGHLCSWAPPVRVWRRRPPQLSEGFREFNFHSRNTSVGGSEGLFANVGNPILLEIGEKLADERSAFRIDGVPAVVLARTSWQVFLRDPEPRTGLRTIASAGYEITLPFIRVETELPPFGRRGAEIRFQVRGVDVAAQPGGIHWTRARLLVWNLSQDKIKLLCGKSYRLDPEWDDMHAITVYRGQNDVLSGTCKATRIGQGEIALDFLLTFFDGSPRFPKVLPPVVPRVPFRL
jgi:hypothetical protein